MSYGVTPFAVRLPQIRKAVGSRSKSILRDLREEFEDELAEDREQVEEANEDDEFDPELSLEKALRHLILDEERWDYEGAKYGYAVEMICSFFGEILPTHFWSQASRQRHSRSSGTFSFAAHRWKSPKSKIFPASAS